ncbi:MAG: bifunctional glutamate N-acetyltransferase/amino-acid acetyltransferase ArgJ [Candidatus Kryptoniota bacterium]
MIFNYEHSVTYPKGFLASGIIAGIKQNGLLDLGMLVSETVAVAAAVFTKNKFPAAPVLLCKRNLLDSKSKAKAIIVNSGCANALTGKTGMKSAEKTVAKVAERFRIPKDETLVASTGVIGRQLPMENILEAIPHLVGSLRSDGDSAFSRSIMTTDKFPKQVSTEIAISKGKKFRIGATAKGAGMIHPNMATMLCFAATDAKIDKKKLQSALSEASEKSFNTVTVDGDTSTNDSVFILANGASGTAISSQSDYKIFVNSLTMVLRELAIMIVRDGEGATRFVKLNIQTASTYNDAVKVGRAVGVSPLVKTAIFGGDPNWGRVISAVGNSDVKFDPAKVELNIGNICVFKRNEPQKVDLLKISDLFSKKEIEMTIKLNAGRESAQVYTCDLSYDYVKINGEYTT